MMIEGSVSTTDMIYFVAEAMALDPSHLKELDDLYQMNKLLFNKAAMTSKYYDSFIIKQNSIVKMEYTRKALGILTYTMDHAGEPCEYYQNLIEFIKKSYPYAFQYVKNTEQVSFDDFIFRFVKKKKGIGNVSDDELNSTLVMLVYLCKCFEKDIPNDFTLCTLMEDYVMSRIELCGEGVNSALHSDALNKVARIIIKKYCEGYSVDGINNGEFLRELGDDHTRRFFVLFDFIPIDIVSLIESTSYDKDILMNIVKGYICYKEIDGNEKIDGIDVRDLREYIVYGALYYKLAQAYGEVRDYYFKNNKETLLLEIENVKKGIAEIELKYKNLNGAKKDTEARLIEAERVNKRLRKEVMELKRNQTDLAGLRKLAFSLKSDEIVEPNEPVRFDSLKGVKAVIVGGQDSWQAKMKEHLPDCVFIGIGAEKFDVRLLSGCRDIFLNTRHMTHKLYYRVIENLDKGARVHYFSRDNIHLCLIDIANSKS